MVMWLIVFFILGILVFLCRNRIYSRSRYRRIDQKEQSYSAGEEIGECINAGHRVNELKNADGPHMCRSHCDCDGKRVCSASKWCESPVRSF